MKKSIRHFAVAFVLILLHILPKALSAQLGFGKAVQINADWSFHLGDLKDANLPEFNTRNWKSVNLPYDWSVKGPLSPSLASATGYLPGGIGWYRKKLLVNNQSADDKVYLYFEGIYNRSEVYINGQLVGKRPNGYISFAYDITPYLNTDGENTIAVKVDHSQFADSRWYTGSGIYRNVWLVTAKPVHFDQWGIQAYPVLKNGKEQLYTCTRLKNDSKVATKVTLLQELIDREGNLVAKQTRNIHMNAESAKDVQLALAVKAPNLWQLEDPYLYQLRSTICIGNQIVDQSIFKTGFRTLTFDADRGFALNGKWMKVKGVCLHHDAGVLGAEMYADVWRRRLLKLKEIGVNAVRTSHNPQASTFYDLCDEVGLLVLNEAFDEWEYPKRKWLTGWNHGTPGYQGSYDFFAEWGERDLEDMVKRDRNHISIFAWSIGNEVDYPNDPYSHPVLDGNQGGGFTQPIFGGYQKNAPDAMRLGHIAQKLASVVRAHDPSRPVTAGLAGVAMSNETAYPGTLDIAGYNYTESRYQQDHKQYPQRVIYGSENRHDFDAWKAVKNNEHIFGQFLWTGIDYLGESGRWPSRGFYSGLLDFAGFIKPRGYFRQALWSGRPVTYLGTYPIKSRSQSTDVWSALEAERSNKTDEAPSMDAWPIWNYDLGQSIRVVCYTNTAKARLELNGKIVGEEKPYNNQQGIISWDIPYAPGALEVVGMSTDGSIISRYRIQTSKRPYALRVLNSSSLQADAKHGVAQIEVQVIDEDGNPVILSDNEVTCELSGPGHLLGLEAGNNQDMGDYTDNKQRVYHGRLIAYIKSDGQPGDAITVRLSSPLLKAAEAKVTLY